MTSGTTVRLEPVVSWPRAMRPGQPYLIEVDLRLAGAGDWPYGEEEFAFTCLLEGSASVTVEAVHDASVVLHRFGGSYGPAEFVVIPHGEPGRRSLWLTIVTQRGVAVRTIELPVDIRHAGDGDDDMATALRPVRSTVLSRSSVPSPEQAERTVPATPATSPPEDVEPEQPHRLCLVADIEQFAARDSVTQMAARDGVNRVFRSACQAAGIDWHQCVREDRGDGQLLILPAGLDAEVVIDGLTTGLETALDELNRRVTAAGRLRLRAVFAEGEIHSYPRGYAGTALIAAWELLDSARMRSVLRNNPDADLAVMVTRVQEAPGFRQAIADLFHSLYTPRAALGVLEKIGYPAERVPAMTSSQAFWRAAIRDLVNGIIPDGLERLLEVARRQFPGNHQLIELHEGLRGSDRRSGVVREQDLGRAGTYPTLTLIGAGRSEQFLRLVRELVDPHAEPLFVAHDRVAVQISDPGAERSQILDRLRRTVGGWRPNCDVTFESYAFRPYLLREITVRGPGAGEGTLLGPVPATVRVRELAAMSSHTPDVTRIVVIDANERLRRLPGGDTLHDAGLREGDVVTMVARDLRERGRQAAVSFNELLRLPHPHLVVNGADMIGAAYGDLPEAELHVRALNMLAQLVAVTRVEVTCVFDSAESTVLSTVPRGVRVLFSARSESAHHLIERLIQAEPAERDVVVVSTSWEPADPPRESLWRVSPLLFLRTVDPAAYEAAVRDGNRDRADDAGADQSEAATKPDPFTASTVTEFIELLGEYRIWSGRPSFRAMARNIEHRYASSTLADVSRRTRLPGVELVMAYLKGCGADEAELGTWREAWRRIALRASEHDDQHNEPA